MSIILGLFVLSILFWIGFRITGALLMACLWLFVLLPLAILIGFLGLLCCCTILLIPVGLRLFETGWRMLFW